jgi:hypothetical protein
VLDDAAAPKNAPKDANDANATPLALVETGITLVC